MTTYFVKQPEKYRRQSYRRIQQNKESSGLKLPPVWTFGTEKEATDFAKTFTVCRVEVIFQGNVIYRNFSLEKPVWLSLEQAEIVKQNNAAVKLQRDDAYRSKVSV